MPDFQNGDANNLHVPMRQTDPSVWGNSYPSLFKEILLRMWQQLHVIWYQENNLPLRMKYCVSLRDAVIRFFVVNFLPSLINMLPVCLLMEGSTLNVQNK